MFHVKHPDQCLAAPVQRCPATLNPLLPNPTTGPQTPAPAPCTLDPGP